jgi:hypothetical protein
MVFMKKESFLSLFSSFYYVLGTFLRVLRLIVIRVLIEKIYKCKGVWVLCCAFICMKFDSTSNTSGDE